MSKKKKKTATPKRSRTKKQTQILEVSRPARRYYTDAAPTPDAPPPPTPAQRAAMVLVQLGQGVATRGADIAAILLVMVGLVSLMGLVGVTSGWMIDWWTITLRSWFGWGVWIVPLSAFGIGVAMLVHNFGIQLRVIWWRVIFAEIAFVCALGLLQMWTSATLKTATAGGAGGIAGWTLSLMLTDALAENARLALTLLFLIALAFSIGLTPFAILRWLVKMQTRAAESFTLDSGDADMAASPSSVIVASPPDPKQGSSRTIKLDQIPREKIKYTKRFTVEQVKETKAKSKKRDTRLPGLDALDETSLSKASETDINRNTAIIEKTLADFGVPAKVIDFKTGPAVTQYAVEPGYVEKPGPDGVARKFKVRVAQISTLANDLALALQANTIRIEAPVPGTNFVGIEVPNRKTTYVGLRGVMESESFAKIGLPLAIAMGRDVSGTAITADLGKMPHLLIAGTTGSGKSVCITSLVTCLVMNNTPEDLRLIMIDPKMVELVRFNGLPHLLGKVEVELERIVGVLKWATREMDRRYKLFETVQARDIANYNQKIKRNGERLPRIVIVLDELADLMLMAPDETERTLVRLAQMARATGMHLVVATQRPSTDIVTGLIKANFPARISFSVASGIDSRVILDTPGAESLLGRGDMLYLSPEAGTPMRLQGCYVGDKEIDRVVTFWRDQFEGEEVEEIVQEKKKDMKEKEEREEKKPPIPAAPWDEMLAREAAMSGKDPELEKAIAIVKQYCNATASLFQRKMNIGFPRAARLMDELYEMGIVGRPQEGGKKRELLIDKDEDPIGKRAKIIGAEDDEE